MLWRFGIFEYFCSGVFLLRQADAGQTRLQRGYPSVSQRHRDAGRRSGSKDIVDSFVSATRMAYRYHTCGFAKGGNKY